MWGLVGFVEVCGQRGVVQVVRGPASATALAVGDDFDLITRGAQELVAACVEIAEEVLEIPQPTELAALLGAVAVAMVDLEDAAIFVVAARHAAVS